ncbi:MAG: hypothetical protein ABI295_08655 [Xanthomarina sp.]
MNKTQIIGIGITIIGIVVPFLFENPIIQTASGVLSAIGLGFVLKLLPLKKQDLTE